ncbi:3-oxoacyl-[acyl-carrier-protein] synthase III C-terminal domain-containing protein [Streptomyces sp. NPDC002763]|uniref:3-oxoacyl-[acyl-carrier-protein] synthase III C-terminal domain-containing protein n=1 Tax=Streptomyces sp. NPDC002763 TaxID=3154427 RepID=UPI00331C8E05
MPSNAPSPSAPAAVLCGLAGWVPPRVVTNDELAERLDTDDAWIRTRTGIRRRHIAEPGQATSDLAVEAGRLALSSALSPAGSGPGGGPGRRGSVDAVIVTTTTPDRPCPATAPLVAARLGLEGAAAFDVGAVCTGFVYGLATAAGLIASRVAERVLLIGADVYSTIVDPLDRANAIIFGDGAGAVVLRAGHPDEPGAVGHFDLGSDGANEDLIMVAAGGSRQPSAGGFRQPPDDGSRQGSDGGFRHGSAGGFRHGSAVGSRSGSDGGEPTRGEPTHAERHFAMRGKEVYRHAVTRMAASARATLDRAGWKTDDVDHFVPHQANLRILHSVADDLALPRERCVANVDSVGNTGAASIPLALADAAARGRIRTGDRLLLTAFGGGLTWGSCLLTWPPLPTHPQPERTTP